MLVVVGERIRAPLPVGRAGPGIQNAVHRRNRAVVEIRCRRPNSLEGWRRVTDKRRIAHGSLAGGREWRAIEVFVEWTKVIVQDRSVCRVRSKNRAGDEVAIGEVEHLAIYAVRSVTPCASEMTAVHKGD